MFQRPADCSLATSELKSVSYFLTEEKPINGCFIYTELPAPIKSV